MMIRLLGPVLFLMVGCSPGDPGASVAAGVSGAEVRERDPRGTALAPRSWRCGTTCPSGFHPTAYRSVAQCGPIGDTPNSVNCEPNTGDQFFTCGRTCPPDYHPSGYYVDSKCKWSDLESGKNSARCSRIAGPEFFTCSVCPARYHPIAYSDSLPDCEYSDVPGNTRSTTRCALTAGDIYRTCATCTGGYRRTEAVRDENCVLSRNEQPSTLPNRETCGRAPFTDCCPATRDFTGSATRAVAIRLHCGELVYHAGARVVRGPDPEDAGTYLLKLYVDYPLGGDPIYTPGDEQSTWTRCVYDAGEGCESAGHDFFTIGAGSVFKWTSMDDVLYGAGPGVVTGVSGTFQGLTCTVVRDD